jgi:hypothetical protein
MSRVIIKIIATAILATFATLTIAHAFGGRPAKLTRPVKLQIEFRLDQLVDRSLSFAAGSPH